MDLDNLTSWFISVLFCATTDAFQGVMLRDETASPPRWFWVNWDMDHSFMDLYQQAPEPWEHDTFATLLTKRDLRSGLVTRLLEEDPRTGLRSSRPSATHSIIVSRRTSWPSGSITTAGWPVPSKSPTRSTYRSSTTS